MTVEQARKDYLFWGKNGFRHIADCPFTDHPFHFHIWRKTEAASIALDLAIAEAHRPTDAAERAPKAGVAWA